MLSLSRSMEIFDPTVLTEASTIGTTNARGMDVTIVGAGATGSHVAYQLIKLGVPQLHLWDKDQVEEHNVANQWFKQEQVGHNKAEALAANLLEVNPHAKIIATPEFLTPKSPKLTGIVVMLVDSMEQRKLLWEAHLKFNPQIKFMIEARMGTHHGQLFTINPMDMDDINLWEAFLYTDNEVEEVTTACGGTQTMCPTASIMAGYMAWQFVQAANGHPYRNNFTLNLGEVPMVM